MKNVAELKVLHEALLDIVRDAGKCVMDVYATDFEVTDKSDNSPVTQADKKADEVIVGRLAALTPDIFIVSEESTEAGQRPADGASFWLVDPLDGTKEFINRNGEFTVNIALIENGQPVLGVVLAPALGRLFSGIVGVGAWLEDGAGAREIRCRVPPAEGLTVVASRSHGDAAALDAYLAGRTVAELRNAGSSLKICLVAAGEADVYPRLGRTMEWDIAAGHAVLAAAGGRIEQVDGSPFSYGKPDFANPHFAAWGLGA
ncbi:3'(2'),5'-bisphosphate nucleotidase CysQ [Methyloversatilis sp.]|uniref:3'(2'),5'-bisphosphate nucleotidase CysQ n=1 Tax=Methyloversatilis sp. TaxID=2569862 RepID=UPI0035B4B24B